MIKPFGLPTQRDNVECNPKAFEERSFNASGVGAGRHAVRWRLWRSQASSYIHVPTPCDLSPGEAQQIITTVRDHRKPTSAFLKWTSLRPPILVPEAIEWGDFRRARDFRARENAAAASTSVAVASLSSAYLSLSPV
uniref:Uncharacterized protein n=1 Tax=Mycena chlorophos TaxID=658473 RepID=A0ABQ0L3P5_MYCCL|nr:predicted protein [Mycena chlorophos]